MRALAHRTSTARGPIGIVALSMCFDLDSAPPIPPISGAAVSHDDLVLESADGNRFGAFLAVPDEPARVGVVILPDVRGLYRFYEELALRLAERGYAAVAFDYFGRTAGIGKRGDDFEYRPHVQQTTADGVQTDVGSCVEHLRGRGCEAVFTLGFCFGGRNSWLAAAAGHGLAGAIGFYGRPGPANDGSPGPSQRAAEMECPILALQGGDDPGIPVEDSTAFDEALSSAGLEHEVVIYPGAPHSFFDRKHEEFAAESEDAWNRVLAFVGRYS
jgi:carboxymethylenebutenolidase